MPRVTRQTAAATAAKTVSSTAAAPSPRPARPSRAKLTARAKARPHIYTARCTAENCCGKGFSRNKMKDARVAMMKHLYRYGLHSIKRAEEGCEEIKREEEEEEDARGPGDKRRQKIKFDDEHLKAYKKELEKGDYDHESEERKKADRDRKALEKRLNNAGMRGRAIPTCKNAPVAVIKEEDLISFPIVKEEDSTPFDRVTLFLNSYRHEGSSYKGFDRRLIQKNLKLVSARAEPTKTTFELTVSERFTDIDGGLHTGAASLILNVCTTITMIASAKSPGVTRSLNVTYIRPVLAMEGSRLIIESEVVAAEERETVILRGIIKDKESGEVICTAEHLKYFTTQ